MFFRFRDVSLLRFLAGAAFVALQARSSVLDIPKSKKQEVSPLSKGKKASYARSPRGGLSAIRQQERANTPRVSGRRNGSRKG